MDMEKKNAKNADAKVKFVRDRYFYCKSTRSVQHQHFGIVVSPVLLITV
jgi:hypothetical protein